AMHRPLLARVRIDGRACLEGALLALAQDPVAFVLGGGQNGPTGNDRASEWHHEQFFGTNCGGADGEEDAEEPAGPIAPDGVHAVAPSLPGNADSLVPTPIGAGPWRLCGGLASNCPIVTLSARPDCSRPTPLSPVWGPDAACPAAPASSRTSLGALDRQSSSCHPAL